MRILPSTHVDRTPSQCCGVAGVPSRLYAGNSQMERAGASPSGSSVTFVNSILGVDKRVSNVDEVGDTPNTIDTSGTTYYIRDPGGGVLGQFLQTGGNTGTYGWFHVDGIGSIRHVTDGTGTLKNRYIYSPFGEIAGGSETVYNPWRSLANTTTTPASAPVLPTTSTRSGSATTGQAKAAGPNATQ